MVQRGSRPSPLFHAIVIVGAAIGAGATAGCGDDGPSPPRDGVVADAAPVDASRAPADAPADADVDAMVIIL